MEDRTYLIPSQKLLETLSLIDKEEKIDKEAILLVSQFAEKYINDILSRSSNITKHRGAKTISAKDVKFIMELEFNYFINTGS